MGRKRLSVYGCESRRVSLELDQDVWSYLDSIASELMATPRWLLREVVGEWAQGQEDGPQDGAPKSVSDLREFARQRRERRKRQEAQQLDEYSGRIPGCPDEAERLASLALRAILE